MAEVLKELSDSRYTVFDVLPAFFNHDDPMVRLGQWRLIIDLMSVILMLFFAAAFEVYVRRAYRAYTLLSIDYEEGDTLDDGEAPTAVIWRFNLGESHSPPSTPNIVGYVWFVLSH